MVRTWIVSLIEQDISARSVNRKLSTLKSYFKFMTKEGLVQENPMPKIQSPKTSKKLPVFVDNESMETLFSAEIFSDDFEGIRDRLILEMFYMTGIRLSELINLKDPDIDFYQQNIKVLGKRNKERLIPVSSGLIDSIKKYLEIRNKSIEAVEQNDYFYVTIKGKKLYEKLAYRIVNSYLGKVSTLKKKSPHVLRHTFATHMLNNGADLNAIKEILGHSSLAATQVYTHNTIEKLKNIYNQAHPRA
jgi:integrase/recombinase XerC